MTPEGVVKREIQDAFKALGVLCIRVNSGRVRVRGGWQHGAPEGTADLLVFPGGGRMLAVEVKQPGERATEVQLAWGADWTRRGGVYVVVDSLDGALDALKLTDLALRAEEKR